MAVLSQRMYPKPSVDSDAGRAQALNTLNEKPHSAALRGLGPDRLPIVTRCKVVLAGWAWRGRCLCPLCIISGASGIGFAAAPLPWGTTPFPSQHRPFLHRGALSSLARFLPAQARSYSALDPRSRPRQHDDKYRFRQGFDPCRTTENTDSPFSSKDKHVAEQVVDG